MKGLTRWLRSTHPPFIRGTQSVAFYAPEGASGTRRSTDATTREGNGGLHLEQSSSRWLQQILVLAAQNGALSGRSCPTISVPLQGFAAGFRGFAAPASGKGGGKGSREGPDQTMQRVNRAITAYTVRLVTDDAHEVLTRGDALRRAQQAGLDLVEVNAKAEPPVCKLMDYSRHRYDEKRKEKEQRKRQLEKRRMDDVKEVRISSRTEEKDVEMKAQMAAKLLNKGHRVKLSVSFKAGDQQHDAGVEAFNALLAQLAPLTKVEVGPKDEGHRMWAIVRPIIIVSQAAKPPP
eukprot:jgi/Mesen1/2701/ME000167S01835